MLGPPNSFLTAIILPQKIKQRKFFYHNAKIKFIFFSLYHADKFFIENR